MKKRRWLQIPWTRIQRCFGFSFKGEHALANFKFHFKMLLAEVLVIYPQAKGKVDPDNYKDYLVISYAPPPI